MIGYNVENVRRHNLKVIAKLLFGETLSCNEIAGRIGISETAVKKNISQLAESGLIVHGGANIDQPRTRGGQHIRYKINENYGCFVFISLSNEGDWFAVTDFAFQRCYREELKLKHIIMREEVERVVERIKQIVRQGNYGQIRGVAAAVPGQVDNETGDFVYSSRFDYSDIKNLVGMLAQSFLAPVYVRNDTQFEVLGELEYEDFSKNTTVYYVDIGNGVSSVIVNNGRFIVGAHGVSGEIGNNITEDGENLHMHCAMQLLIEKCEPFLSEPSNEALIASFRTDRRVREIVLESARVLARQLDGITNALGSDLVILMGKVCEFGDDYADCIRNYFDRFPKSFQRRVVMSGHSDACYTGMRKTLCDGMISSVIL